MKQFIFSNPYNNFVLPCIKKGFNVFTNKKGQTIVEANSIEEVDNWLTYTLRVIYNSRYHFKLTEILKTFSQVNKGDKLYIINTKINETGCIEFDRTDMCVALSTVLTEDGEMLITYRDSNEIINTIKVNADEVGYTFDETQKHIFTSKSALKKAYRYILCAMLNWNLERLQQCLN